MALTDDERKLKLAYTTTLNHRESSETYASAFTISTFAVRIVAARRASLALGVIVARAALRVAFARRVVAASRTHCEEVALMLI